MDILLVIFFTSFAGLCAMIFRQRWEIKKGKIIILSDKITPIFPMHEIMAEIQRCYASIPKQHISAALQTVSAGGRCIVEKLISLLQNIPIKKRVYKFIDRINGKQNINISGKSSSLFIHDILEHKAQIRRQENGGEKL